VNYEKSTSEDKNKNKNKKKWLPLLKTNRFIHSMLGDLLLTRQTIKISSSASFYLCPAKKKVGRALSRNGDLQNGNNEERTSDKTMICF